MRKVGPDTARQLLDDLGLRSTTDSRHRDTGVDRGTDTGVEEVGLEEDLTVGNRDDVGRHEGRHVAGLGLDDRQGGQRPGLAFHSPVGELLDVLLVDAGSALKQTRVEIENVAGIGFAARRAAQQQRNLTVGNRLFGQIVIDDQRVFTAIAEVFAHRAARVGSDVLHGRRFGRGGSHDDGVGHCAGFFELANDVGHGGGFLADRDIDAEDALALLIDDGVDCDRGLAGLAVADDQLTLAAADRDHGVDRLQTGLDRLGH